MTGYFCLFDAKAGNDTWVRIGFIQYPGSDRGALIWNRLFSISIIYALSCLMAYLDTPTDADFQIWKDSEKGRKSVFFSPN